MKSEEENGNISCRSKKRRRKKETVLWLAQDVLLLLLLHHVPCVQSQSNSNDGGVISFNYEVEKRIIDRLSVYMNLAVDTNLFLSNYRFSNGFPNNLHAVDRDFYTTLVYNMEMPLVYYGLEDGTCVGSFNDGLGATSYIFYREPGSAGYSVDDPNMTKHLKACVDKDTGSPIDCVLDVGDGYVKLQSADNFTDNVLILPCQDEASQRKCSSLPDIQKGECESRKKYCIQYTIEEVTDTDPPLGFVPFTNLCHDIRGKPTQEINAAVLSYPYIPTMFDVSAAIFNNGKHVDESQIQIGNCTYSSGNLVERNVTGNYAYCGTNQSDVCNGTFVGGYEANNYDPRYRPWYIDCKRVQKPGWTDPYPFFSDLGLGITATHPIYDYDDDNYRKVFAGVLAVDYKFDDIRQFLLASYGRIVEGTDTTTSQTFVAVYEDEDPHYIIALSTGTSGQRLVLTADPTRPCPATDGTASNLPCEPQRIPLADLVGTLYDEVLVHAFLHHKEAGYPKELIKIEQDELMDRKFYLTQSSLYEQPGANLRWRVIVAMPSSQGNADTIEPGDPLFGPIIAIGTIGFVVCLAFAGVIYRKRQDQVVRYGDWRFTCAFILGCAGLNCSTLTSLGPNTDTLCMLRLWSFHGLFTVALSPLFVKVYRIWRLIDNANRFRRVQLSNTLAVLWMSPMILVQFLILLLISFIDPPRETAETQVSEGVITESVICGYNSIASYIIPIVYECFLVIVGCILACQTRNLSSDFGESKQMIFSMYNIALAGSVFLILLSVADIDLSGRRLLRGVGVWWGTVFSSAVFVIPKLLKIREARRMTELRSVQQRQLSFSNFIPDSTQEPKDRSQEYSHSDKSQSDRLSTSNRAFDGSKNHALPMVAEAGESQASRSNDHFVPSPNGEAKVSAEMNGSSLDSVGNGKNEIDMMQPSKEAEVETPKSKVSRSLSM